MYTLNSQMENKFSTIIDIRFQIIPNFRLVFDTERQVKRCFWFMANLRQWYPTNALSHFTTFASDGQIYWASLIYGKMAGV